jgi:hypothetical protein
MTGQMHAAAVLYPGKIDPKPNEYGTGWVPEPFSTLRNEKHFLSLPEIEGRFLGVFNNKRYYSGVYYFLFIIINLKRIM